MEKTNDPAIPAQTRRELEQATATAVVVLLRLNGYAHHPICDRLEIALENWEGARGLTDGYEESPVAVQDRRTCLIGKVCCLRTWMSRCSSIEYDDVTYATRSFAPFAPVLREIARLAMGAAQLCDEIDDELT